MMIDGAWILTVWLSLGGPLGMAIWWYHRYSSRNIRTDFSGYEQISQELFQGLERLSRSIEYQNLQTLKEVSDGLSQVKEEHHRSLSDHRQSIVTPISGLTQQLSHLEKWHQQIDQLSYKVHQLTRVLDHSSLKGKFGERHLELLLKDRYPSSWIQVQPILPTGVRADFAILPGSQDLLLIIDSKFPVQSFKMVLEDPSHVQHMKDFVGVMKKSIADIAQKYIIPQITRSHAILFVPSDALFFKLIEAEDLLDYAQSKNVLICCPQSLYWIIDLIKEHYFQNQWILKHGEYFQYLSQGRKAVDSVFLQWEQWDKRCTQLRLEGRTLRKELDELRGFFSELETFMPGDPLIRETPSKNVDPE